MYCLTNRCYVCLEQKDKSLININSSLLVNKDIIGCLPCNLAWMKTKQIVLICEECCRRLREFYQFPEMCLKNSSLMQGYLDKLNTASISIADYEAELRVDLYDKHNEINDTKCEIKLEDGEIYTFERDQIVEESEDVFVNVEDSFVKEEDTWKTEAVDDKEESPMDNNFTVNSDKETDSDISVNNYTHDTDSDSDGSEITSTQVQTTNKKELNTPVKNSHKCLTCSKSFSTKAKLQMHTRVHTGERPYKCARCEKCFTQQSNLIRHMRTHTGEKPYECSKCKKCFTSSSNLVIHMRIHTGVKPHKCAICEKCFTQQSNLIRHMRTHTGEKAVSLNNHV